MSKRAEKRKRLRDKADAAIDRVANDDQVNPFAQQHGIYVREGNRAALNRGGTPVARWKATGQLTEVQSSAIDYCIRLWDRAGRHTGLVQDLLKVVGQSPSTGMAQQEALDQLADLKTHVPRDAWEVFENVCRFDMPAGTAGSALASNDRSAIDAARTCVRIVADMVALRKGWQRR